MTGAVAGVAFGTALIGIATAPPFEIAWATRRQPCADGRRRKQ
jgi:hypothetical protein